MAEIGRPTVMTPETIARLEDGFLAGLSDREACLFANIAPSTLYAYCEENPDFSERKELLKEEVKLQAKLNIKNAITGEKRDLDTSKWYTERKDRSFSLKQELEHSGALQINIVSYGENDHINNPLQLDSDGVAPANPKEQGKI